MGIPAPWEVSTLSGVTDTGSISVERGNFSDVDTSKALWEPRDLIRGDAVTGNSEHWAKRQPVDRHPSRRTTKRQRQ